MLGLPVRGSRPVWHTRARSVATSTATKSRSSRLPPSSPPATKADGTARSPLPTAQLKRRKADELRVPPPVLASEGEAPAAEEAEAPLSCWGLAPAPPLAKGKRRSPRAVGHETVRLLMECCADIYPARRGRLTAARAINHRRRQPGALNDALELDTHTEQSRQNKQSTPRAGEVLHGYSDDVH